MGLINKTSFNFMVKQGEKLIKSSIIKKSDITSVEELRYIPQKLASDTVKQTKRPFSYEDILTKDFLESIDASEQKRYELAERLGVSIETLRTYLKKFGLYKPVRAANTPENKIEQSILQELVNKGLSLHEIANELGVKIGKVRIYLAKFNIVSDSQKEFRMLKKYFTATNRADKEKAFKEIDNYLQQMAKEELKLNKGITYEDCLQDIRLRFFELVDKSKQAGVSSPYKIFQAMRESKPQIKQELHTVSLAQKDFAVTDYGTELFEAKDYESYLWQYVHHNLNSRNVRNMNIMEEYLRNDKTIQELSEHFGLTPTRMKDILDKNLPKLQEEFQRAKLSELA